MTALCGPYNKEVILSFISNAISPRCNDKRRVSSHQRWIVKALMEPTSGILFTVGERTRQEQ